MNRNQRQKTSQNGGIPGVVFSVSKFIDKQQSAEIIGEILAIAIRNLIYSGALSKDGLGTLV